MGSDPMGTGILSGERGVKCIKLIVVITVQLHGFTKSHEFFILNGQFVGHKNTTQ